MKLDNNYWALSTPASIALSCVKISNSLMYTGYVYGVIRMGLEGSFKEFQERHDKEGILKLLLMKNMNYVTSSTPRAVVKTNTNWHVGSFKMKFSGRFTESQVYI